MTLGELIKFLEQFPADQWAYAGFGLPHSYRGHYDQLAFEPRSGMPFGDMLASAKSALNKTFQGYKGGEFKMDEDTPVWLANYGETGVVIDGLVGELRATYAPHASSPSRPITAKLLSKHVNGCPATRSSCGHPWDPIPGVEFLTPRGDWTGTRKERNTVWLVFQCRNADCSAVKAVRSDDVCAIEP